MGQKIAQSPSFAGGSLGVFVLLAVAMPHPAHAQHADAGVQRKALAPPPPPAPHRDTPTPPDAPSGVMPKIIDPAQLSEGTRARLAERAAGQHPSSLPSTAPAPHQALPHEVAPSSPPASPRLGSSEPLRRGQARMRVQAVETDEGVTLLSNRLPLAESRLTAAVAKRPLRDPEPREDEARLAVADPSSVTEMHSLRPSASRGSSHATKSKNASSGLGWLLWPFVLFVTTSAVVASLWLGKKTWLRDKAE